MSVMPCIPDDPADLQRLLEDLLRRNDELRQQAQSAQQQAESAQQQADIAQQQTEIARKQAEDARRRLDELERVLEETAADYDQLKEKHAELAETLALLRRYVFGQRRERFIDAPGQGHLFDIPEILDELEPAAPPCPTTRLRNGQRRPALRGEPGWTIFLISAFRTICPRARRPALAAVAPKRSSVKTSPANLISSRRGWR